MSKQCKVCETTWDAPVDRCPRCTRPTNLPAIDVMVDRFLGWKLPEDFHPDAGISFTPEFNVEWNAKQGKPPQRHEPVGTNLFTATQARAMFEHVTKTLALPSAIAHNQRADVLEAMHLALKCAEADGWGDELQGDRMPISNGAWAVFKLRNAIKKLEEESAPSTERANTLADRLEALGKKATDGPWAWDQRGEKVNEWGLGVAFTQDEKPISGRFDDEDAVYVEQVCQTEGATVNYTDPALICELRNNLPEIVAALRGAPSVLNAVVEQTPPFSLRHLQQHLPWTIPYSDTFESYATPLDRVNHDVLHVMKSLGRIAAECENHHHGRDRKLYGTALAKETADLVICALHIARLEGFDLQDAVVSNSEARNAASIPPEVTPRSHGKQQS